jgi:hypothetical protein
MLDLYLGLAIMLALAVVVFGTVASVSQRLSSRQLTWLAVAIVLVMGAYAHWLWHNPAMARWLPVSNLVIVGNWFPWFLFALGGVVYRMPALSLPRRAGLLCSLALASSYALLCPLLGTEPRCSERYSTWGDAVQTTDFTCTAASAATLLRAHGIEASEQEMAELCLTRRGTSWLGLYRGLKLKTAGTPWEVEVVCCPIDGLNRYADRPMLVDVGLPSSGHVDAAFREEFGWSPGTKHSVILNGFSAADRAQVIDPAPLVGREEWDAETLALLWRGYGMRLVPRAAQ